MCYNSARFFDNKSNNLVCSKKKCKSGLLAYREVNYNDINAVSLTSREDTPELLMKYHTF